MKNVGLILFLGCLLSMPGCKKSTGNVNKYPNWIGDWHAVHDSRKEENFTITIDAESDLNYSEELGGGGRAHFSGNAVFSKTRIDVRSGYYSFRQFFDIAEEPTQVLATDSIVVSELWPHRYAKWRARLSSSNWYALGQGRIFYR